MNETRPYLLYQHLFQRILTRSQAVAPKHSFRFKNPLYSLDASVIDLCLSIFPWAKFRATKGAIKLHVGLNHEGYLPTFVAITDAKTSDLAGCQGIKLPPGSIIACDRGYIDYRWFHRLNQHGLFFVTRLKRRSKDRVTERRKVNALVSGLILLRDS